MMVVAAAGCSVDDAAAGCCWLLHPSTVQSVPLPIGPSIAVSSFTNKLARQFPPEKLLSPLTEKLARQSLPRKTCPPAPAPKTDRYLPHEKHTRELPHWLLACAATLDSQPQVLHQPR